MGSSTTVATARKRQLDGDGTRSDERQPLLVKSPSPASSSTVKPFPLQQILILFLMRFSEPVAALVIFPFISKYIERLGVTDRPERVGYYAGMIESLFALTMVATVLAWGRLSDRIGRKPVMLIGLSGATFSVAIFGLQKSFIGLVLCRMLGGALNGNVAVIKSMVAELTDSSNQARAFSYLPLAWSTGSVIAPIIGGSLSNPAKHYPNTFGRYAFFHENPYFLPCFVAALFPLCGLCIGVFFLEETLRNRPDANRDDLASIRGPTNYSRRTSSTVPIPAHLQSGYDTPRSSSSLDPTETETEIDSNPNSPPSIKSLFKNQRVLVALTVYAFLALQTIALDALFVLFAYSPISVGGLAFDEASIGKALGLGGAFTVLFQLFVFPPLQKRFGTVRLYRSFMSLYPLVFCMFPIMARAAARAAVVEVEDFDGEDGGTWGVWPYMVVYLLLKSIGNCSYGCNMLVITEASPSRRSLGTLNGLAQMLSSSMRAIGPLIASSLFVVSKEKQLIKGEDLVWYVMVLLSGFGFLSTWRLREGKAAWRREEEEEEVVVPVEVED